MGLAEPLATILVWQNPMEGVITSLAGLRYNPITGDSEFHDGIDIAAPIGTPIYAPRDGVVLAIGRSESFGIFIRMEHEEGYISFFAHLNNTLVNTGEKVQQGEKIATSGNTGWSTGPHLHFGLFRYGQFIDPLPYVDLPFSYAIRALLS